MPHTSIALKPRRARADEMSVRNGGNISVRAPAAFAIIDRLAPDLR